MNHKKLIEYLIKCAYLFYSNVGKANFINEQGFKKYKILLEEKLSIGISKDSKWNMYIKSIQEEIQNELLDYSFQQFPSYILRIKVLLPSELSVSVNRYLIVNYSLLCNMYTLFYEDSYHYKIYNQKLTPRHKIIFFERTPLQNSISQLFENVFKEVNFISHHTLMETKIKADMLYTDYGNENESFSLYDLLFDGFVDEQSSVSLLKNVTTLT